MNIKILNKEERILSEEEKQTYRDLLDELHKRNEIIRRLEHALKKTNEALRRKNKFLK